MTAETEAGLRPLPELGQMLRDERQILHEPRVFARLRGFVRQAQQEGRVHRDEALDAVAQGYPPAPRARDGGVAARERARRGRAERHGEARLDQFKLLVEPPAA